MNYLFWILLPFCHTYCSDQSVYPPSFYYRTLLVTCSQRFISRLEKNAFAKQVGNNYGIYSWKHFKKNLAPFSFKTSVLCFCPQTNSSTNFCRYSIICDFLVLIYGQHFSPKRIYNILNLNDILPPYSVTECHSVISHVWQVK